MSTPTGQFRVQLEEQRSGRRRAAPASVWARIFGGLVAALALGACATTDAAPAGTSWDWCT